MDVFGCLWMFVDMCMCQLLAIVNIFLFLACLTYHLATPHELTPAFFLDEFFLRMVAPATTEYTTVIQRTLRFSALSVFRTERTQTKVPVAEAGRLPNVYKIFGCVFIIFSVCLYQFHFTFLTLAPLVKFNVYRPLESVF